VKNQKTSKQWTRARLIGSIRLKARTPARKSPGLKRATHLRWPMNAQTTTLVAGGLAAAVLFVVWLQPAPRADDRTESVAYNLPGPARTEGNRSRPSTQPPSAATLTGAARPAPRKSSLEPAGEADAAPVHATLERDARPAAPVTLTGCLERDDETFRLKNTTGDDAPKARSRRSGFIRKRAAAVDLVDAGGTARLPKYVGQRIAATGLLVDREMQVQSLQRLATSCS